MKSLFIRSFYIFIFSFILPCITVHAEEKAETDPSWFLTKDKKTQKFAVMPSYYRNAAYGHTGGLRFFIYPSGDIGYYTALEGKISEDLFMSSAYVYEQWLEKGSRWNFSVQYSGFHDFYYGKGSQTKPENIQNIAVHRWSSHLEYMAKWNEVLFGGVFIQFLYRSEREQKKEIFPNEWGLAGGLSLLYDSRNNLFNPYKGEYYQVRVWAMPRANTPVFLEGDVRLFFPFAKNKWVLAFKMEAAYTFRFSSTYLFRFHLGGPDKLRGFRVNRFHGEKYYLSQLELRWTLFKFLTLAGFVDIGAVEMRSSAFGRPRYSYGGGLRFGLPPDYNKHIRVEFGKGEDQSNFVVAFGHPF